MIQIIQLKGMEQQLYQLVAPLVMDPVVIRANNNYPFKTNDNYVWFIATEEDKVVGFLPLELRKSQKVIINNYYVVSDNEIRKNILSALFLNFSISCCIRDNPFSSKDSEVELILYSHTLKFFNDGNILSISILSLLFLAI